MKPTFSVVIPVFNEEENLPELQRRLEVVLRAFGEPYEIIFVDDSSQDKTPSLIKEAARKNLNIKLVRFSRNFGHQAAISAGLDYASGDAIVIMDGDLQDPPEVIPEFIRKWREGYDVVYGIKKKRKEWWGLRLCYLLFYRILRFLSSGTDLPLDSGDFSLISRRAADAIKSMPERNRYVRGLRSWVGFQSVGVPFERGRRYAGESKYNFRKLLRLAYDGIFSFSYAPLRFITGFGFLTSAVSFVAILIVLYFRLFTDKSVPGFASLAIIILFIGGIQLLSLGIIGEYISRIYDETKKRPHYVIEEKVNL